MTPDQVKQTLESTSYTDKLEHMFAIQEAFADLCFSNNDIRDKDGTPLNCSKVGQSAKDLKLGYNDLLVPWIWEMHRALLSEMDEVKELLPWKHWSKAQLGEKKDPDLPPEERLNHLRLELVDLVHFIMEALIFTGMTSEEVYQMYLRKNFVNIQRQIDNYNCATKTEEDNNNLAKDLA